MAAPTHTRITLSGTFVAAGAAVEEWQTNICTTPLQATTAASATLLAGFVGSYWFTNLANQFTADIKLNKVRVAVIGTDGHVNRDVDGSYKQGDDLTVRSGTGAAATGTGPLPLQTALVSTLVSAHSGAAGKGRMFWPFPRIYALQADYRLQQSDAATYATKVAAFLHAVAADTRVAGSCVVASGGTKAGNYADGALYPILSVNVGTVPDTMRSRRGRLIETRSSATV